MSIFTPQDYLSPDPLWYTRTTNQRLLRKHRLTAPMFLTLIDTCEPGFREMLHALTKDIYDNFSELDFECEQLNEAYNPLSSVDIYTHCFQRMDLGWEGLPLEFKDFVFNHL